MHSLQESVQVGRKTQEDHVSDMRIINCLGIQKPYPPWVAILTWAPLVPRDVSSAMGWSPRWRGNGEWWAWEQAMDVNSTSSQPAGPSCHGRPGIQGLLWFHHCSHVSVFHSMVHHIELSHIALTPRSLSPATFGASSENKHKKNINNFSWSSTIHHTILKHVRRCSLFNLVARIILQESRAILCHLQHSEHHKTNMKKYHQMMGFQNRP